MSNQCNAPVFEPLSGLQCSLLKIRYFILVFLLFLLFPLRLIPSISCYLYKLQFTLDNCETGNSDPDIDIMIYQPSKVRKWLEKHPDISGHILWKRLNNQTEVESYTYPKWTMQDKIRLFRFCALISNGLELGLPEAPDHTVSTATTTPGSGGSLVLKTNFTPKIAWDYFLGFIAMSLVNEVEKRVSWSFTDSSDPLNTTYTMIILLNSDYFFQFHPENNVYSTDWSGVKRPISSGQNTFREQVGVSSITPGDPVRIYNFLKSNDLVGNTRLDTINNVLIWCREHLRHMLGYPNQNSFLNHWQYDGYPPVERIIAGTVRNDDTNSKKNHYTGGCWCTTGFLTLLLKTCNIPVMLITAAGTKEVEIDGVTTVRSHTHALTAFIQHKSYLSHSDDLYNRAYLTIRPQIQGLPLLITENVLNKWFGPFDNPTEDEKLKIGRNIGKKAHELAVDYVSLYLLDLYCSDMAVGANPANGSVFNFLKQYYTLDELKTEKHLWTRFHLILQYQNCSTIKKQIEDYYKIRY